MCLRDVGKLIKVTIKVFMRLYVNLPHSGFQGYRKTVCVTHLHSSQRGLTGEIFPSAVAQAQGFIILSLARLQQCHPVEERDRGNISEEGSARWGLTPRPPWERHDSLFRKTSDSRSPNDKVMMKVEMVVVREMPYSDISTVKEMIYL